MGGTTLALLVLCSVGCVTTETVLGNAESLSTTDAVITTTTELITEETTPPAFECLLPWNVTVTGEIEVRWRGEGRGATVRVTMETVDAGLPLTCPKRTSVRADFSDGGVPPPLSVCSNTKYNISLELICGSVVADTVTVLKWTPPDVPTNVGFAELTATSFELTWDRPEGDVAKYRVRVDNSSDHDTSTESIVLDNLEPDTHYDAQVSATNEEEWSGFSNSVAIKTKKLPSVPANLTLGQVTNTTLELRWDDIQPSDPVSVQWYRQEGTNRTVLKSLDPEHMARVRSESGMGSSNITTKTLPGILSVPKNLQESNKTSRTIRISWSPPDSPNGPLRDYEIVWGAAGGGQSKNTTGDTSFRAEGLTPYTKYSFRVSASTSAGYGASTELIVIRTEIDVPSAPTSLSLVRATNATLEVAWRAPAHPNGPVLEYLVQYSNETEADGGTSEVRTTLLSHVIADLDPYSNCSVRVAAETGAGRGPWTEELVARTDVGVPRPAKIVLIAARGPTTLLVEWGTLVPYPGPTSYVLEVWRKPDHCPGHGGDDVRVKSIRGTKGPGEWKYYREEYVEGLRPYSRYRVRIVLETKAGRSDINTSVVATGPDLPGAPRQVHADCKKSTTIEVKWKPPEHPNGKITEYLVRYGLESVWNTLSVPVADECASPGVRLEGLRPERSYKIYVSARAKDVAARGAEASFPGRCELPAGVPPVSASGHFRIADHRSLGSPSRMIAFEWGRDSFSDSMGALVNYAVLVGHSDAVGNASSGTATNVVPNWSDFTEGAADIYQATPRLWNPFEGGSDPLECSEVFAQEGSARHALIRCTVGLETDCLETNRTFCNGPLQPATTYGIKLRAYTRGGFNETKALFASTAPVPPGSSKAGVILGVVFAFVSFGVAGAAFLVLKKKGKLKEIRIFMENRLNHSPSAPPPPPSTQDLQLESYINKTLNVINFAEHVRVMLSDSHLRFSQEFEYLKVQSPTFPCAAAEMEENRPKNRWLNILPYDHSRVKLLPLGDETTSDYINANYIPGHWSLREYIATQGPLPCTVDDLWRMAWEQGCAAVVMLTQCAERGRAKCERYWPAPSAGPAHYGDLRVRCVSESILSSYAIRIFDLQLGSQERRVKQMHFTRWPDFGCPESPDDLINFIRATRDHLPRVRPGPIIVHCSAGVGRTGTFIAVDRLAQQLRHSDTLSVYGAVLEQRHHRVNMVQTEDQYIYIHLCVKQLIEELNQPRNSDYEDVIYSNVGIERDSGV